MSCATWKFTFYIYNIIFSFWCSRKRKNLDCDKANIGLERLPLDDDGFESLNGNGSSDNNEEENNCDKKIVKKPSHINDDILERQHYDDLTKSLDFESHKCSPNVEYKKSDLSVSFNSTDSCNVRTDDAEVEFHRDWLQYKDQTKPLSNISGMLFHLLLFSKNDGDMYGIF